MNNSPLSSITPLAALAALLIVGVTIEVVEGQNRQAAWALMVVILLGVILVNTPWLNSEIAGITGALNARGGGQGTQSGAAPRRTSQASTAQGR